MSTDPKKLSKEVEELSTYKNFQSLVKKFGLSISNFYDVNFVPNLGIDANDKEQQIAKSFLNSLINRVPPVSGTKASASNIGNMRQILKYFAEECTIPGSQIATSEYRIGNTPQVKYAYGTVNSEATISFLCDGRSEIKKTFDAWMEFIYGTTVPVGDLTYNRNTTRNLGRSRYRDEYACDIIIVKFERTNSSDINRATKFFPDSDIIPDSKKKEDDLALKRKTKGFGKAQATYSVRLKNAFPTNVSSISLSSGASDLTRVQVSFDYEMMYSSPITGTGSVLDIPITII